MKKYLITGALALVACATLTSCHSDDELSGSLVEQKLQTYEQVFKQEFGEINPNQDWGFGTAETLARIRTADEGRTRGTFSNGNEWAANDRADCMYKVPPVLSEDQMDVVRTYFQTVQGDEYEDPQWTDYFIQQVYKGGVDADKIGPNSTEKYKAADNQTDIIGSNHMDHLAAVDPDKVDPETGEKPFVDHNKNFNHGDCGVYGNVLNYKGTLTTVVETYPVNSGDAYRHADKINLMTNSTTKSFGYYNSNCSLRHTEYTRLVSWSTIHTWALTNYPGYDGCLNDGWNRSYMGFDFEMLVDNDVYAIKYYDEYGNETSDKNNAARSEIQYFSVELPNGNEEVWNGTKLVAANTVGEVVTDQWGNKKLYPFFPGTQEKVALLSSNANEYAGKRDPDWNGTNWEYYDSSNTKHLSIADMVTALQANKLPLNSYNWVSIGHTADGWYSDWIVTLTEAQKYNSPEPQTEEIDIEQGNESSYEKRTYKQLRYITKFNQNGRIMCEDLGTSSISDIDFNDIVFDAWMYDIMPQIRTKIVKVENGRVTETIHDWSDDDWTDWTDAPSEYAAYTLTDVYLLAGGGTIPATVAGVSLKNAFGTDNRYLVNTVDERDPQNIKRYGNPYKNGNPYNNRTGWNQPIIEDLRGIKNLESFNKIDVVVLYNNSPVPLTSEIGEVPHKICVPIETKWPYERIVINEAYDFNRYVKEGSTISYDKTNAEKIENSKGETIGYYFDERNRKDGDYNVWTMTPTDDQADNRYTDINGSDITGIPYRDSARVIGSVTDPVDLEGYEVETVSIGSSSGYKGGNDPDPVLIRVRH